jgi:hypothetical protein
MVRPVAWAIVSRRKASGYHLQDKFSPLMQQGMTVLVGNWRRQESPGLQQQ